MLKGFRDFILRGNVVDLAVAVVIGAVVRTFVDNIITPIIAALVADGLSRAKRQAAGAGLVGAVERLRRVVADSRRWLAETVSGPVFPPDVVYLDPMFPARGRIRTTTCSYVVLQTGPNHGRANTA